MITSRNVVTGSAGKITLDNEDALIEKLSFAPGQALLAHDELRPDVYVPKNPMRRTLSTMRRISNCPYVTPIASQTAINTALASATYNPARLRFVGLAVTGLPDPRGALYCESLSTVSVATEGLVYARIDSGLDGDRTVYGGGIFCIMGSGDTRATLKYQYDGQLQLAGVTNKHIGFLVSVIHSNYCAIYLTAYTDQRV